MADKAVLAEDSYRTGCAHCHAAYRRRGYSHMEAFAAVCHLECHEACRKDYRRECMEAYREACRMEHRKVYQETCRRVHMEAYRVSAGDMDWN